MNVAIPPKTERQLERDKLYGKYQRDDRYHKARSCRHCTDTADSFGSYLSSYCHIRQEHIGGSEPDLLDRCMTCELYEKRSIKK